MFVCPINLYLVIMIYEAFLKNDGEILVKSSTSPDTSMFGK